MTEKQKYYLDIYKSEADKAYESMQYYRIDYDTFKQISDASYIITEQAKKVFNNLYPTYINYPVFLRGLKNIYDNSKEISDLNQEKLQKKLDLLNSSRSKYDSWINKINAIEVEVNNNELSNQIDEIANLPENLIRSNELAIIQEEIEKESAKVAQDAKDKADVSVPQNTNIIVNEITGKEVCLDKYGNEIDMSICKPPSSSGSISGGVGGQSIKTASDIVNENIENWLKGVEDKKEAIQEKTKETAEEPANEPTEEPDNEPTEETIQEPIKDVINESEDYINSFIFNVDLSKYKIREEDETIIENKIEVLSPELDNINDFIYRNTTLETEQIILNEDNPIEEVNSNIPINIDNSNIVPIYNTDSIIKVYTDTTSNTKIFITAALIAAFVGYTIIKKKD